MMLGFNGVGLHFRGTLLFYGAIFGTLLVVNRDQMFEVLLVERGHLRRDIGPI